MSVDDFTRLTISDDTAAPGSERDGQPEAEQPHTSEQQEPSQDQEEVFPSPTPSLLRADDLFAYIDDANAPDEVDDEGGATANPRTQETLLTDVEAGTLITEGNTDQELPEMSEGRASELEYNFLDESDRSEQSDRMLRRPDMPSADTPANSPRSDGRAGKSRRAPPPPTPEGQRQRSASLSDGTTCQFGHLHRPACPSALVKYHYHHPHKIRFLQLSYNTNLRKPPDNWLRMKHRHHSERSKHDFGPSFWSYPFSKSSSWSMFSSFRYGGMGAGYGAQRFHGLPRGRHDRSVYASHRSHFYGHHHYTQSYLSMRNFDLSTCLCCDCCNCSQTNQTCCCCCYHCVHTISSCRRSDLLRLVPVPGVSGGPTPSILKKPRKPKQTRKRVAPAEPIKADEPPVPDGVAVVIKDTVGHESGGEASSVAEPKTIKERGV